MITTISVVAYYVVIWHMNAALSGFVA